MIDDDYRDMVEEIRYQEGWLTEEEFDFVSDMLNWQGQYSEKQKVTIKKIHEKVM